MNSLTHYTTLLKRFPQFELSYETVSHKKVSSSISVALAISLGRKYFIWYTYKQGTSEDACYLIGLDKEKQICSIENRPYTPTSKNLCLGTILYGTIYEHQYSRNFFVVEDIYYYCGVNLSNQCFGGRIGFLKEFMNNVDAPDIFLSVMWHLESGKELSNTIPADISGKIGYTPHHIQYRDITRVAPYINIALQKRGFVPSNSVAPVTSSTVAQKMTAAAIMNPIPHFDFSKPAFRYTAIFNITADPQLDLYHLYAYGGPNVAVYCGLAGIQSLNSSMFMNKHFRRIRENDNLDLAEESEDEEDFENTDLNKYVNIDAVIPMECVFNQKHKKWMPVRLARKEDKLIHIEKLIVNHTHNHNHHHHNSNHHYKYQQNKR
jgi:hypothetical protein